MSTKDGSGRTEGVEVVNHGLTDPDDECWEPNLVEQACHMNGRDGKRVSYEDTDSEDGPKVRSAELIRRRVGRTEVIMRERR